ncbi:hypothetical protein V5P93_002045 [Actinokineospora auranticolor]|uniref:Uncharacterized protein n=1 Tax=Actinokineospora auranticolor TaxID=155976 RepID=A0A2S6GCJ4_9PSEU|nr:hypothetical protein [Actinokineospora auranticolor]PPK62565.1 hypothetical protein CLV40_13427 [Actinokineospora auranticolor]
MWIALTMPFVLMLGAVAMQRLEPTPLAPVTSDDPLQHAEV